MDFSRLNKYFEEHDNFAILTHQSPDGDALGSGFALCAYLRDLGKKANVLNSDGFPDRYDFLYAGYYKQDFSPESIVAVDVADPELLGNELEEYKNIVDVCIDHHISNKNFAKETYVDPQASAACLILYSFFKFTGKPISSQIAKCLYTGLATDTGCFKYENTTPDAHIAAAELMQYDIDFAIINRKMFDVRSKERIKAEIAVTNNMEYFFDGKCAVIVLTKDFIEKSGIEPVEFDGMASIPLSAEGVEIGITVKQRDEDFFKISVRTTEKTDASMFCKQFGGGGHIRAAGCAIRGSFEEVMEKIIHAVSELPGYGVYDKH